MRRIFDTKFKISYLFFVTIVLILAFGILASSALRVSALSYSQSFKVQQVASAQATPTPTVVPKIDYYLPYPGLLPDHLLYSFKMARDRISLMLTTDPVKKAEKLLLYADKRLGTSKALVEGNKVELGVATLTKSERYLEQAIDEAGKAKKAGKDTLATYEKLSKAALKHRELIEEMSKKMPETEKRFQEVLNYPIKGYELLKGK